MRRRTRWPTNCESTSSRALRPTNIHAGSSSSMNCPRPPLVRSNASSYASECLEIIGGACLCYALPKRQEKCKGGICHEAIAASFEYQWRAAPRLQGDCRRAFRDGGHDASRRVDSGAAAHEG